MNRAPDLPMPEDVALLMGRIDFPLDRVAHNCHAVSHAIVASGIVPGARVARGAAVGVIGQHSWVVADGGPYDMDAHIIDATIWSYDATVPRVWQGTYRDGVHRPHGWGHFMQGDKPSHHGGETVTLTPSTPLSIEANMFLHMLGELDNRGWMQVAHLPVQGWPAREVIEAMLDTPNLAVFVPVDIAGMLTDRNPGGLYL
ncbi:hypothetical protein PBI_TEAMOCIL_79 [Microbacterium phage Teamocil]|uniref:Uncharacterized protein n=1 Tax=Microbacterium phage Teamocil TaxID=2656554 RepID=A0A649VWU4_9CAUD|nr:hypothetical protein QDA12_gp79 [Microbacterium phage Teamocil]QGJ88930.1 hypothetical protein PBI_GINA_79 [Microbacterium phage Gina]QGJ97027.1 hypothetical protein PBI_TEAMOCIL_79 [Microbacterium phage Teamocil]